MKTSSILALTASLGLATVASAQVLMLDFGPTTPTGENLTNSPYHTAAPSFTGKTWNVTSTDIAAGNVRYSDNSVATNVTVNVGTGSGDARIITLANTPTSNALGGTNGSNTQIYQGDSVGRDAIFTGSSNTVNGHIGVQIGNLPVGTYDVYVSARMTNATNSAADYSQTVFAQVENASTNFAFGGYAAKALTYTSPNVASGSISAWAENDNYVKFTISITTLGQFLNLAVDGSGSENRGFLNSLQIVNTTQVPEPSAFAALAGLGALGFAASRRRRA